MYFVTLKTLPDDPAILNAVFDAAPADATPEQLVPEIIKDEHGNARPFNIVRVPQPADLTDAGALTDFYFSLFERGHNEFGKKTAPAISVPVLPAGTPDDPDLAEKSLIAVIAAVEKFTKNYPASELILVLSIDTRRFPKEQRGFFEVFGYCERDVPYEAEIRSRRTPAVRASRKLRLSIAPGKSSGVPAADETRIVKERAATEPLLYRRVAEKSGFAPAVSRVPFEEFEPDYTFQKVLFWFIQAKEIDEVKCYTRARIDRRHFSKIRSNRNYRPSKETACAFALALQLDIKETKRLLESAGYTLSRGLRYDRAIRYYIEHEKYDLNEINSCLHSLGEKMFGAS